MATKKSKKKSTTHQKTNKKRDKPQQKSNTTIKQSKDSQEKKATQKTTKKTTQKNAQTNSKSQPMKNQNKETKLTEEKKLRVSSQRKDEGFDIVDFIQMILEIIVAAGFFYGLFGYNYLNVAGFFVLPLTLVNFILASVEKNKTISLTAINLVLAFIAFSPPILGRIAMVVGIVVSILSASRLSIDLFS